MPGYHVGIQAWYNQALAVDPTNPQHVYVSLEEVFETDDGGADVHDGQPVLELRPRRAATTLPAGDAPRPARAAAHLRRQVVIGNDGGVYRRPMSVTGYGNWTT